MKPSTHFIIVLICSGVLIYHGIVNKSVLSHPYMVSLMIAVLAIDIYHAVAAVIKILKE